MNLAPIESLASNLRAEIAKAIIGQQDTVDLLLVAMLSRGHILLEGVPGTAKTFLAQVFAHLIKAEFGRIQFTPDLLPGDLIGTNLFSFQTNKFKLVKGPIFCDLLLADEINRAPAKAQSALLEAMEERQVTVDGVTRDLPDPFFVIATQNPGEQRGVFGLPESQLDRFLMGVSLGYPDKEQERSLLANGDTRTTTDALEPLLDPATLAHWMTRVDQIHIADSVLQYLHELVIASRAEQQGLSPRAGLGLVRASRAFAFVHGRDHVLPDDVKAVFASVAGHRLTGSVATGLAAANAVIESVTAP